MSDFVQSAQRRWPTASEIRGTGRYAIARGKIVYLFERRCEAEATCIDGNVYREVPIVDLQPQFIPNCRGDIGYWEKDRD